MQVQEEVYIGSCETNTRSGAEGNILTEVGYLSPGSLTEGYTSVVYEIYRDLQGKTSRGCLTKAPALGS
jgi:hypothetical protein